MNANQSNNIHQNHIFTIFLFSICFRSDFYQIKYDLVPTTRTPPKQLRMQYNHFAIISVCHWVSLKAEKGLLFPYFVKRIWVMRRLLSRISSPFSIFFFFKNRPFLEGGKFNFRRFASPLKLYHPFMLTVLSFFSLSLSLSCLGDSSTYWNTVVSAIKPHLKQTKQNWRSITDKFWLDTMFSWMNLAVCKAVEALSY